MRSGSVYGGAGGSGVCICQASQSFSFGGSGGSVGGGFSSGAGFGAGLGGGLGFRGGAGDMDGTIIDNEKFTIQNLNDCLASYLEKVHSLEKTSAELECKIHLFLDSKTSPTARDHSGFLAIISELQSKVCHSEVTLKEKTCFNAVQYALYILHYIQILCKFLDLFFLMVKIVDGSQARFNIQCLYTGMRLSWPFVSLWRQTSLG